MTVLFKRLTVVRFLTVPPSAVHGLPKYDGIPPSTGTDVQHGKITSGIFPRTTLKLLENDRLSRADSAVSWLDVMEVAFFFLLQHCF